MRACTKPVGRTLPQLVSMDVRLPYFYMALDAAQALFQETARVHLDDISDNTQGSEFWSEFVDHSRDCLNGLLYWKL